MNMFGRLLVTASAVAVLWAAAVIVSQVAPAQEAPDACSTMETKVAGLKAQNPSAKIVSLVGEQAKKVLQVVEGSAGPAPKPFNGFLMVFQPGNPAVVVGFFIDNCFEGATRWPEEFAIKVLDEAFGTAPSRGLGKGI